VMTVASDNTARVWDAKTFSELATLKGHTASVYSVAVSPDGSRIVTGSADKTAHIWDAKTFAEVATLAGHTGSGRRVAVTRGRAPHCQRWRPHGAGVGCQELRRAGRPHGPFRLGHERGGDPGRGPHRHRLGGQDDAGVGCQKLRRAGHPQRP